MAALILIVTIVGLLAGYRFYAYRQADQIIQPNLKRSAPARRYMDGVDFIPTHPGILLGFQFKSISLDPIIAPIIALQFGWLPAILWILFGTLFIGWVQDYLSIIISMRSGGMTLSRLVEQIVSPRAGKIFQIILYIYLLLILGEFTMIISPLLAKETVATGIISIVCAGLLAGQMIYRWRINTLLSTSLSVSLAFLGIYISSQPTAQRFIGGINDLLGGAEGAIVFHHPLGYGDFTWTSVFWIFMILTFCYLGATLPIWRFAQPVNYVSSWFIFLMMLASIAGVIITALSRESRLSLEIPAVVSLNHPQLGPIWPILFVTISSGAISGWHSLVSTYSTSRQVEKETHALPVSAGALSLEAILVILAVIFAATIGVSTGRFDAGQNYRLVAGPAGVFATGMTHYLMTLGISDTLGNAIGAIFLTVMGLTVMQLVLRYLRMVSAELMGLQIPALRNAHIGSLLGILIVLILILSGFWQWLWVLFVGTNLLVAGIALLMASIWLLKQEKPNRWTLWPAVFLSITSISAIAYSSIYLAIYKSLLTAQSLNPSLILGNLITAIFGLFMILAGLLIFRDGLGRLTQSRTDTEPQ
ncbi:MAG TPA: carbon starvation CstA family protein [Anaerolineales bacterium]|nr:carbon starvation CstA family protein [Anaerolineales bacterium]